jgi:hypothetical protein
MDEDEAAIAVALASWLFAWLGGVAALHWAVGWSWWWAVPVPLVPAVVAALVAYGLFVVLCILFEDVASASWVLGWLSGVAALHWGLGWSWWWAVPVAFFVAFALSVLIVVVRDARTPPQDETVDFEEEEEDSEPEPPPASGPARAATVMDELAKKLFVQLDDPMPGQRINALEMLRARLAKDGQTFRDLLHEFEGRPNG